MTQECSHWLNGFEVVQMFDLMNKSMVDFMLEFSAVNGLMDWSSDDLSAGWLFKPFILLESLNFILD